MFIPRFLVEKFSSFTESGINRILAAKDAELAITVAAKDEQIKFLREQAKELSTLVGHERARAEAAIDSLLEMKANVAGIRNADILRQQALAVEDAGKPGFDPKLAELRKVFQSVAGVGDDDVETEDERRASTLERLSAIGGMQIGSPAAEN